MNTDHDLPMNPMEESSRDSQARYSRNRSVSSVRDHRVDLTGHPVPIGKEVVLFEGLRTQ